MRESSIEILRLLAENETAVCRLYRAYADKFPSHKTFWLALADEELAHASWIRKLSSEVGNSELYVDEARFRPRPIEIMHSYVKDQLTRAQEQNLTLVDALSTALDIEQSLIERSYFDVFETDSVGLKHVLMDLKAATQKHIQQVQDLWEAARG